MFEIPSAPTRVHYFIEEHSAALQHAALMIGGRPWLRRAQQLFETLRTQNSLHGQVNKEIVAFHHLLTATNGRPHRGSEVVYASSFEPTSSHFEDIKLLADDLWHVFQKECANQSGQIKREEGNAYA